MFFQFLGTSSSRPMFRVCVCVGGGQYSTVQCSTVQYRGLASLQVRSLLSNSCEDHHPVLTLLCTETICYIVLS